MADIVSVELAAHHQGKVPGDRIETDAITARRLVSAGVAVPATVADAKAVGAPADEAATKR